MPLFVPRHLLLLIVLLFFVLWPWSRILRRMGFSAWLCLLLPIPLVNLVFLYYLAFGRWPRDDQGSAAKQ
jgi:hypothetical protein